MSIHKTSLDADPPLEANVLNVLAESQNPVTLTPKLAARMRKQVLANIADEKQSIRPDFITVRRDEGEWTEIAPKLDKKVLFTSREHGVQSYLLRLHPGFELEGHAHPMEEECLVLEGELTLGSITLKAGDYHLAPRGLPHGYARAPTGALLFIRGAIQEHSESISGER